jgi:hypothetical protein
MDGFSPHPHFTHSHVVLVHNRGAGSQLVANSYDVHEQLAVLVCLSAREKARRQRRWQDKEMWQVKRQEDRKKKSQCD